MYRVFLVRFFMNESELLRYPYDAFSHLLWYDGFPHAACVVVVGFNSRLESLALHVASQLQYNAFSYHTLV